ncbi:MAG: formimidoylglutamate deiminase, partial [Polyangiales bacterium]
GLTEHRGPAPDSFWTWRELMYHFVAQLAPEDVEVIAAQAYVEMLEAGFTRVGEFHYLHHDPTGASYADPAELSGRVVAAAAQTGIGLCLLPVFYAHGGFGGLPLSAAQQRFGNDVDRFARVLDAARQHVARVPGGRLGVAPHSLRAVTPDELAQVIALAPPEGPIHIHAAEQLAEVEACERWSGQRPITWLLEHAPLDTRFCVVHATHMTRDETRRLAASGAVAGLCPITEANLGDGIFPAGEYLAQGGRFGVGSDSNVLIRASEELRLLEYGQRLTQHARNVLATPARSVGRRLFEAALIGGGQALGSPAGIAVGAPADLVSFADDHPSLHGRRGDALLDSWIFAAADGCIDRVWCGGVERVTGGRHVLREAVARRYRATLARLVG